MGEWSDSRYRRSMNEWAPILVAGGIIAVVAIRETLRWRGRRWRKSGPRGTQ
ncbi:unannotated protein [freshwater metagenome]|uniref:Unannotated protein n=1 Tax=freshwater metagenome TaxID=449393 RepID=A0A6J6UPS5_9ZZZZ